MRIHELLALSTLIALLTSCGQASRIDSKPKSSLLGDHLDSNADTEWFDVGARQNLNVPPQASPAQSSMMQTAEEMNDFAPPSRDPVEATAWARTVLEVPPNPSASQVSNAYRRLALKWHPERAERPSKVFSHLDKMLAKERFQNIQSAFTILTNRPSYDADQILKIASAREDAVAKRRVDHEQRRAADMEQARAKRTGIEHAKAKLAEEQAKRTREDVEPSKPTRERERRRQKRGGTRKDALQDEGTTYELLSGDFVTATGLKDAAHLNGKTGVIVSFDEDAGSYVVDFEEEDGQMLLAPHKLIPMSGLLRGLWEDVEPIQVVPEAEQGQEAKASPRAKSTSHFPPGFVVIAKGLTNQTAFLNGKMGVIQRFDKETGSHLVSFEFNHPLRGLSLRDELVRPENLLRWEEPGKKQEFEAPPRRGKAIYNLQEMQPRQIVFAPEPKQQSKAPRRGKVISHFPVGVFVVAKGLDDELAFLNGETGEIISCDKHKGSYLVDFEGGHGQIQLDFENLGPLSELWEEPEEKQVTRRVERDQEEVGSRVEGDQEAKVARDTGATHEAKVGLDVGVYVVAKDLEKKEASLNGKTGVVKSFDKVTGDYLVDFEGKDGQRLLKARNIDPPWSLR